MIKVLAVDDEEPIRQWLNYCITRFEGFCCVTAANAQEALELYQIEQPDVVLSDIGMPGMNGLEMLRVLRQSNPGLCSIVLTSHDDFEYARAALKLNTMEYLLKTEMNEESLYTVLKKTGERLQKLREDAPPAQMQRERFLQAIALGKCAETLSDELMERHHISLYTGAVLAIDCWNCEQDMLLEAEAKEQPALRDAISFMMGADHLVLLMNLSEATEAAREAVAASLQVLLQCRNGVSCGISDIHLSLDQLPQAMEQARGRCALQYYLPVRKVYCTEPVPPEAPAGEELFRVEYMRCLLDQDFAAAYKRLLDFVQQVQQSCPSDIAAVKKELLACTTSFLHFAAGTAEEADVQEQAAKEGMLGSNSFAQLQQIMDGILQSFLQHTGSWGVTAPIQRAIEYIEQHYAEKITLGDIAGYVAFSPEHFSRLFAKETGVTFVTYTNNLRMKHAVTLLETTNDKVYEIADRVGFSSLSYFSTSFKKKVGQNPYEYQISYQKQKGRLI